MVAQSQKILPKKLRPARVSRDELIARAEQAIDDMRDEFGQWIEEEIKDLSKALSDWLKTPTDPECIDELFRRAHDLKGQAPTLGYPIVGRISASLCQLLGLDDIDSHDLTTLTTNHVEAIKAAVRDEIRDEDNQVALALACELESAVSKVAPASPN